MGTPEKSVRGAGSDQTPEPHNSAMGCPGKTVATAWHRDGSLISLLLCPLLEGGWTSMAVTWSSPYTPFSPSRDSGSLEDLLIHPDKVTI